MISRRATRSGADRLRPARHHRHPRRDDPHLGLIQFKVGTGGEAVEYVGEWDLPLNTLLYKAFDLYMKRRG